MAVRETGKAYGCTELFAFRRVVIFHPSCITPHGSLHSNGPRKTDQPDGMRTPVLHGITPTHDSANGANEER